MLATVLQLTLDFEQEAQTAQLPGSEATFGTFLSGIISATMVIGALLVLMYLIWGAIDWISAGGDSSKVQKAREKITTSVVGILVLASTLAIFAMLQQFLGIEVLNISGFRSQGRAQDATQQPKQQNQQPQLLRRPLPADVERRLQ